MQAREFSFVPMGKRAPEGAIAWDGLVDGAALDLSHWPRNATPEELKADTSVEIALAFVRANRSAGLVVNNHFDADGVLSVFVLLDPDVALAHEPVLARRLPAGTQRVLVALEQADGSFRYRYEMPSWAWAETTRRPRFRAPSRNALAVGLGPGWALKGGELGMTGLLRTTGSVRETPPEIAAALLARERFEGLPLPLP